MHVMIGMCIWHQRETKGRGRHQSHNLCVSMWQLLLAYREAALSSIPCSTWCGRPVGELTSSHTWCLSQPHPNSVSGWDLRLYQIPNLFPWEGSTPEGHFTCSLCVPFNVSVLSEGRLHWLAVQLLELGAMAHLASWRSQMSCYHLTCVWCTPIQILKNNSNNS